MEPLLLKIFATALTLSQVLVIPQAVRTSFDPVHEQEVVRALLIEGCAHLRKVFNVEDLNLDDLVTTIMDDPEAISAKFQGLRFADLHSAYRIYCNGEPIENSPIDIRQVIEFYNTALADLPDPTVLRDLNLPGTTTILDWRENIFTEVHEPANRRISVPLQNIPKHVQRAFIS